MTKIKAIIGSLFTMLAFAPALALAQNIPLTNLDTVLGSVQALLNRAIPILIGIAVIFFLFGVLKFVMNANDPEKRKEGRMFMVWGIIAIVVMFGIWGLVSFVMVSLGLNQTNKLPYPTL